jgi:hypothetical protein
LTVASEPEHNPATLRYAAEEIAKAFVGEGNAWRERNNTKAGCEWDLAAGWVTGWAIRWGWYEPITPDNPEEQSQ